MTNEEREKLIDDMSEEMARFDVGSQCLVHHPPMFYVLRKDCGAYDIIGEFSTREERDAALAKEKARAALAIAEAAIRKDCVKILKEKHCNGEPTTERDYIQAEAAFNTILASIPEKKDDRAEIHEGAVASRNKF